MIGDRVHRERHIGIGTVNGARRRVNEMLDRIVPATFRTFNVPGYVGVDVGMRGLERVADSRLRREMYHAREPFLRK